MSRLIKGMWTDRQTTVDCWCIIGYGLHKRTWLTLENWDRLFNICSALMDLYHVLYKIRRWLDGKED
jgi:hypothetical protein